jgi:hypothetical protein
VLYSLIYVPGPIIANLSLGFVENAVAIWQALLELHHFTPTEITPMDIIDKRGQEVLLSSFERFWESEVPRIGEDGAEGWDTFVRNGEVGNVPEPKTHSSEAKINGQTSGSKVTRSGEDR